MDALTDMLDVYFPAVDDEQDEPDEEVKEEEKKRGGNTHSRYVNKLGSLFVQADKYPSAITFSTAIAHLSRVEHVDTFLSIGIDTNWMDPHGDVPFALFFDQACSLLSNNNCWVIVDNPFAAGRLLHSNLGSTERGICGQIHDNDCRL